MAELRVVVPHDLTPEQVSERIRPFLFAMQDRKFGIGMLSNVRQAWGDDGASFEFSLGGQYGSKIRGEIVIDESSVTFFVSQMPILEEDRDKKFREAICGTIGKLLKKQDT